jgi:benzoyl-CoA reductase/2-hydroxyglutaryl-CoA dehydratase subunit BcrC/BadD/HgdB
MDYDRLKEVLDRSYRITEIYLEINELRKAVPEPFPCEGIFAQMAVFWLLAGTPEAVTFFELLLDEIKQRVKNKVGVVPQERFRLILPFVIPFWDMVDYIQEEHGAVIAMEMLNTWGGEGKWLLDRDKPLENLARKTFFHPACYQLHGPMEPYVQDMVQIARDYQVDGAINFAHIGCRQACGCIRALKDELQDELGMSMAVIDCDLVDKSFTSREEVCEKLDGFFEILAEQKELKTR